MTPRDAFNFSVGMDARDVFRTFDQIERRAQQAGRAVGRIGGATGRGGAGIGGIVGAGAGLGAGVAVFEQFFERLFELFEDTPVLNQFLEALDGIFEAAGPLVGVLLDSLTPVLKALTPVIGPLAEAFAPFVELLGTNLLVAVKLLTPLILPLAQGLGAVARAINEGVTAAIQFLVDQINRLPFVDLNIELPRVNRNFATMVAQIEAAGDESDDASPKVKEVAGAIEEAAEAAGRGQVFMSGLQASLLDAHSATELVRIAVAENALTHMAAAETVADNSALWERVAEENAAAMSMITTNIDILNDEMDETFTATDNLGAAMARAKIPIEEAGEAIEDTGEAAAEAARVAAEAAAVAAREAEAAARAVDAIAQSRAQNAAYREGGNTAAAVDAVFNRNQAVARALGIPQGALTNLFDSDDGGFLGANQFLAALGITARQAAAFGASGRTDDYGQRQGIRALIRQIAAALQAGGGAFMAGGITIMVSLDGVEVGHAVTATEERNMIIGGG